MPPEGPRQPPPRRLPHGARAGAGRGSPAKAMQTLSSRAQIFRTVRSSCSLATDFFSTPRTTMSLPRTPTSKKSPRHLRKQCGPAPRHSSQSRCEWVLGQHPPRATAVGTTLRHPWERATPAELAQVPRPGCPLPGLQRTAHDTARERLLHKQGLHGSTPLWPSDTRRAFRQAHRAAGAADLHLPREWPCGRHTLLQLHTRAQGWGGPASCQAEGHGIDYYWAQPSVYGGYCAGVKDVLKMEQSHWRPVSPRQAGTDLGGAGTLQSNTGSWSRAAPPTPPLFGVTPSSALDAGSTLQSMTMNSASMLPNASEAKTSGLQHQI